MSQITCSGSGPANSATTSAVPSGCSAIIFSTSRRARSRTDASVRATTFGVNALLTMLRRRRCRGSSMTIIDPKYSEMSGLASLIVMLGLELKMCGCRLAYQTSSNRVTAQWPAPPCTPGVSSGSWNEIGASRRRVANAPSRRSSSRTQNFQAPRSMSDSGTSGGAVPFTRVAIPTSPRVGCGQAAVTDF